MSQSTPALSPAVGIRLRVNRTKIPKGASESSLNDATDKPWQSSGHLWEAHFKHDREEEARAFCGADSN